MVASSAICRLRVIGVLADIDSICRWRLLHRILLRRAAALVASRRRGRSPRARRTVAASRR